jgi:hypothetical protein
VQSLTIATPVKALPAIAAMYPQERISGLCGALYGGRSHCRELFGFEAQEALPDAPERGLWERERLLADRALLERVADRFRLALYTGRNPGEAALALVRMHTAFGEPRYIRAAERALDWLVGWYDFFGGGFFYGEEHWTCIAAEAAWPTLRDDRYREFCDGYADFLRRQQLRAEDFPDQADLAGTYGVSPFIVPNNTPVGSRSEAMISAYLLDEHHGMRSEPLRQQILRSMRYALRQQVRPEGDYWIAPSARATGAIPSSSIDPNVRIDYVQHVGSAMLRSAPLVAR